MMKLGEPRLTPKQLANVADGRTACICFFGGDPSCNPQHSLKTARLLMKKGDLAVCYESNGNISGKYLRDIAEVVRNSGGTIKVDLKAMSPSLYTALTGVSNTTVVRNFRRLAQIGKDREDEFLVASILLIPGYIGVGEVRKLTEFIASLDETIPTALLGFMPHLHMKDLPRTSRKHADSALHVAKESGLTNVKIGNRALLSNAEYAYD
jgi:pyruvate formate lyase activating enzyme